MAANFFITATNFAYYTAPAARLGAGSIGTAGVLLLAALLHKQNLMQTTHTHRLANGEFAPLARVHLVRARRPNRYHSYTREPHTKLRRIVVGSET